MNKIIANLECAEKYAKIVGEEFRARAFAAALSFLRRKQPSMQTIYKIISGEIKIAGIGSGIISRMQMVLSDSGIASEKRKYAKEEQIVAAYDKFLRIYGVGNICAASWINEHKITTLGELKKAIKDGQIKLTAAQKLGLKYYADLQQPIPRAEVAIIAGAIMKNSGAHWEIAGSYRRGRPYSGDVDIIATDILPTVVLTRIANDLSFIAFLSRGLSKISFLYRMAQRVRIVDIFILLPESFIAGLLYATGSADHNIYIRGLCKKQGLKLTQYGLTKEQKNIALRREKDLYKILGIKYVPPSRR